MELKKYRVTNFRSVSDSDWISVDRVIAFIGVNESGKTNLLLPLWKFNPAREGELHPTSDYPKKLFGTIREEPEKYRFITTEFEVGGVAGKIAALTGRPEDEFRRAHISRFYDGRYEYEFPDHKPARTVPADDLRKMLQGALNDIENAQPIQKEEPTRASIIAALKASIEALSGEPQNNTALKTLSGNLRKLIPTDPAKTSVIVPRLTQLVDSIDNHVSRIERPSAGQTEAIQKIIFEALPKFVYYSNYGNLDSEIYLPHVVQNLKREDLGSKEAAKARTLRVLFDFVRLAPQEILELGQDFKDPNNPNRQPTPDEITAIGEKKRERSILLQSASALLTERFREWWKQGDYRFRFEADGNHFRIWVADDRRPEEIELESRSTGLQWFLSFYLVFLVESKGEHRNSILLLDEPGLSLHPLAQRDLSAFFAGLAETNQIIYTTHSPFLVDADNLDRARKVYVSGDGTTKATENLREGGDDANQAGAAYAVHSALNLNVAESLLLGCQPIIVEGASDQHCLTSIKTLLIRAGKIKPKRELVFPPSGGAKTARIVASILTGRDDVLPIVLLDDDMMGRKMAQEMKTTLYQANAGRILNVRDFVEIDGAEIEDLFPSAFVAAAIDRLYRVPEPDQEFSNFVQDNSAIVSQIESWAAKQNVALPKWWKVELAKRMKQLLLAKGIEQFDAKTHDIWTRLFEAMSKEV
ncbi:MAG: AAA family ATPase [Rhizomicrobium sp.]